MGQTLLCPKCSQPITIQKQAEAPDAPRRGGGIASLFDEEGFEEVQGPRCPQCGAPMSKDTVLCVKCGYNRETGETVVGAQITVGDDDGMAAAADSMMEMAEKQIQYDKQETKKNQTHGAPIWLLFSSLTIVVGFAATMYLLPRDQAFWFTGVAVIGLAGFVQFICLIRIYVIAFFERMLHGMLCLFIPPYLLFYVATRWRNCGTFVGAIISGGMAQAVGYGMVWLSPALKPEEVHLPKWNEVPAVVRTETSNQEGILKT